MPPILTQVSRRSDALPLVATSTPSHNLIVTSKHQADAKQLMMSMTTRYELMCKRIQTMVTCQGNNGKESEHTATY
jgi:hypothetical protein